MTLKYRNYQTGLTYSRRITIRDCDGDDPTCEEYHNNGYIQIDSEISDSDFFKKEQEMDVHST